jgi:hypothetical protein
VRIDVIGKGAVAIIKKSFVVAFSHARQLLQLFKIRYVHAGKIRKEKLLAISCKLLAL